MLTNQ